MRPDILVRKGMVALALVNGGIPGAPEIVEQRALRRPDDVAFPQAIDELLLALFDIEEEPDLRRRTLGEDFANVPQLEQCDRRIPREVFLRLRRQRDEPRVVVLEEREVRGGRRG